MALLDGLKVVTTAGTRVQMPELHVGQVVVQARKANTGKIAVGASTVVAAAGSERGIVLSAGESAVLDITDLQEVWIDSTVNGEGVSYVASDNVR